jgi:hypothetical protein
MFGGKFSGRQNAALQMAQQMEQRFIEPVSFSISIPRQALPPQYKTVEDSRTNGPVRKIIKSHFGLRALCPSSTGPRDDFRRSNSSPGDSRAIAHATFTKKQASNPS